MSDNSTKRMIDIISPVWQRVLQRDAIGVDDNFFDLGGDPELAYHLFNEIAEVCGRECPPVTICYAPTIASLAAVLIEPRNPPLSTLVRLQNGDENLAPLFMAPGGAGIALDLCPLARHIRCPRPIYGIQTLGSDGGERIFDDVEDAVECYLKAIQEVQPHGPYLFVGYSAGGFVMLEIAKRLLEIREKTDLLVMIDSYPHRRFLTVGQRARLVVDLIEYHVRIMRRLPVRKKLPYVLERIGLKMGISKDPRALTDNQPLVCPSLRPAKERLRRGCQRAWLRYRPSFYGGNVIFVKAETGYGFPKDPAAVWSKLTNKFEVETVPGDHFRVITKNFAYLAAVISRHLETLSNSN